MPEQYVYPVRSLLTGITRARSSNPEGATDTSNESRHVSGLAGEPVEVDDNALSDGGHSQDDFNFHHPPSSPTAFANVLSMTSNVPFGASSESDSPEQPRSPEHPSSPPQPRPNFNPSDTGIVHLGPISPIPSLPHLPRPTSTSNNVAPATVGNEEDDPSLARSEMRFTPGDTFVTTRFEHIEDEHGHHVLTQREGEITRCEDEPIRTPGAIQQFGVLIAVEETDDKLVVRQVSENSSELLGLSPSYLFSLQCFTDALPDSQSSLLWDNIQFLPESTSMHSEDDIGGPHVFLLSGWGEPDSNLSRSNPTSPGLGAEDPHEPDLLSDTSSVTRVAEWDRPKWTCWCAIHRPPVSTQSSPNSADSDNVSSNLVILEFELEQDIYNPLYPPTSAHNNSTSTSTLPESGHPNSSDSCDNTLVPPPLDYSSSASQSHDADPRSAQAGGHAGTSALAESSSAVHLRDLQAAAAEDLSSQPEVSTSQTAMAPRSEWEPQVPVSMIGLQPGEEWVPSPEDIVESTTSRSKPLPALERLRRLARPFPDSPPPSRRSRRRTSGQSHSGVGMMDIFAVLAQINEQLGQAADLDTFLKVLVGILKDLTQFHRVLVYQFDEEWNGQVVGELVDWTWTHDLYKGLHFPASDIPPQARELYTINKVRFLYDRTQPTARLVVRSREDLASPLNLTHCFLRAMSPIHIKYLSHMGVRASMSVSIIVFGTLWGLVACHSYGSHGMRVSFPVRQMLRLLSQSISRNIERLSYASRLHTRKLLNTVATDHHPTGYIVSNADDLLGLFDADFGVLVVGDGAKILGPNVHSQEILIIAEYLRMKQFTTIQISQEVTKDFRDLDLPNLEVIAGVLCVPLSSGGRDFIAFLRKGQPRDVHWAGIPNKDPDAAGRTLEPRKSFKIWSETVAGRCRAWTDEQLETAGVLSLVYGKFIEVWRQKESALQTTRLTNLLLSNASHEVRTPLNHIINYLEMALNGPLDGETRDNLRRSHDASKSLLFTINDLLDLTRLESGKEVSFHEPFDLQFAIEDATRTYHSEAERRNIEFVLGLGQAPRVVVGDEKKIRTVVQNLTANALKYTERGSVCVVAKKFGDAQPEALGPTKQTAVEIMVSDTGKGIAPEKLEKIFQEFEQVETNDTTSDSNTTVGLGLAVVARIIEQLGGQLRVDSRVGQGSSFSFLIPLALPDAGDTSSDLSRTSSTEFSASNASRGLSKKTSSASLRSVRNEATSFVDALGADHMSGRRHNVALDKGPDPDVWGPVGTFPNTDSLNPVRPVRVEGLETSFKRTPSQRSSAQQPEASGSSALRFLIVEDNDINRKLLAKRLSLAGHTIVNTTNGQEGLKAIANDREFDCILMDLQMPILDGFQATEKIRELESLTPSCRPSRQSHLRNGGRIPIFAVSASLYEDERLSLVRVGFDGWMLKPINFKRLVMIMKGVIDVEQRQADLWKPGCSWEAGGWLGDPWYRNA